MMCIGGVMPFYEYETIPGVDYLGRGIQDDISFKQHNVRHPLHLYREYLEP